MAGSTFNVYSQGTFAARVRSFRRTTVWDAKTGMAQSDGGSGRTSLPRKGYAIELAQAAGAAGDRASYLGFAGGAGVPKLPTSLTLGQGDRRWMAGFWNVNGTSAPAQTISDTGTAYDATVSTTSSGTSAPAQLISSTGSAALNLSAQIKPTPTAPISVTGTAYSTVIQLRANAGLATQGVGSALAPAVQVQVNAALASQGTGTAYNAISPQILVNATLIASSGTAYNPTAQAYPVVTVASGLGGANTALTNPTVTVGAQAASPSQGIGTAYGAVGALGAQPQTVQGVGASYSPVAQLRTNAQTIAASGSAYDVTVQVSAQTNANAQLAGPATGTAYNALPTLGAQAGVINAGGITQQPSVTVYPVVLAPAGLAGAGTGTAYGPTAATVAYVSAPAQTIAGTGTAYNPTVVAYSVTLVSAQTISATGTTYNISDSVSDTGDAQAIAAIGTAYNATTSVVQVTQALAGLSSATSTLPTSIITLTTNLATPPQGVSTAQAPISTIKLSAQTIAGSGTAYVSTTQLTANLSVISVGGIAQQPSVTAYSVVLASAGLAGLATGTAYAPTAQTYPVVLASVSLAGPSTATAYVATAVIAGQAGSLAVSGTSYNPVIQLRASAPTISSTGSAAYNPTVTSYQAVLAAASLISSTGSAAFNPVVQVRPNLGVIASTGTAYDGDPSIKPNAASATQGVGSLPGGVARVGGSAQVISTSGTAYNPTISAFTAVSAPAGVATATGAAIQASVLSLPVILASAGLAGPAQGTVPTTPASIGSRAALITSTGSSAYIAVGRVGAQAGTQTAFGGATNAVVIGNPIPTDSRVALEWSILSMQSRGATPKGPTNWVLGRPDRQWAINYTTFFPVQTSAPAALISTSGTAHAAVASVGGSTQIIAASGSVAYNAGITTGFVASSIIISGTAQVPSTFVNPNAQTIAGSGASYNPTVTAFQITRPNAALISISGTAYNPTVFAPTIALPPSIAASGAAYSPTIFLRPNAQVIASSGTAYNPTALNFVIRQAFAGGITSSATANNVTQIVVNPTLAGLAAPGTAYNPAISAFTVRTASAQLAGPAAGTAYNPSVAAYQATLATAGVATSQGFVFATAAGVKPNAQTTSQGVGTALSTSTVVLGTITVAFSASTLTVTPGTASINVAPATASFGASALTSTNDFSRLVDHRAAALGFEGIGKRTLVLPSPTGIDPKDRPWATGLYDRGIVVVPITAPTSSFTASPITVTIGAASVNLSPATAAFSGSAIRLNGKEVDLPPAATVVFSGQTLTTAGGAVTVSLLPAVSSFSAVTPNAVNLQHITAPTIHFEAQQLVAVIDRGSVSQFLPQPVCAFQGKLTTSEIMLYTVPSDDFLVIKQVNLQATGAGTSTTRLWSVPRNGTPVNDNAFMFDTNITTLTQHMTMILGPGDKLYGYCATNDTVTVRIEGFLLSTKSLPTPKVWFRGLVSNSHVEVAVVDSNRKAIVKQVVLANTTASSHTVDLSVVTSGAAPGPSDTVLNGITIPANDSVLIPLTLVLDGGKAMTLKADSAGAIAANVSGVFA